MSKKQNGYVFCIDGESILYEPKGDVRGLKNYAKAFKDQPITSAIVPTLSQLLNEGYDQVPAKIDDYISNKKYN